MSQPSASPSPGRSRWTPLLTACAVLTLLLAVLFSKSFRPELVLFSNDAPLGIIAAESGQDATKLEGLFTGYWQDLNWIGIENPTILPGLSFWIYQLYRDPVLNAKLYAPISLLILGLSSWLFFRQLGFRNVVCVLAGIATALNMNTFSHVCWGLPSRALAQAAIFLALAALQSATTRHFWIKAVLGGMAVGLAIMEGFDVGALYSLYVAAFAFFLVMVTNAAGAKKIARGLVFVGVIAICAGWFAAHALSTLIGTQIKGVGGSKQDDLTREQRWDYATWWSLPKIETLRVLVPGLFGYRMDTEGGGNYWGRVGEQPAIPRHSGAGEYAGILVVMVGAWAAAHGFRKKGGPFTDLERRHLLFWTIAGLVSILFAWGRHAPFYKIIYSLPYFSTIRNPIKFMHFFHLSWLILFGFGLEGIYRLYISPTSVTRDGWMEAIRKWWRNSAGFDRKWTYAAGGAGILAVLGFLIYFSSSRELDTHLRGAGFPPELAKQIAQFSYKEVALFILFYLLSFGALVLIQSGFLAGPRWKLATLILGGLLVVDLARANQPWIVYYDYKARYANGPIFELLAKDAHERRVTGRLFPFSGNYLLQMENPQVAWFGGLENNWLQNQYQFYDIMSLEVIQFPRIPTMDETFIKTFSPTNQTEFFPAGRLWELTSTRLLVAQRGFEDLLNRMITPGKDAFRLVTPIAIVPRSSTQQAQLGADDVTTEFNTNGPFAVIEFTNALPRVKLFTRWEVEKDDTKTLARLRDPAFEPASLVMLSDDVPAAGTNEVSSNSTASFASYSPKEFTVKTESAAPGVLLVTDRYSPNWKVWVDGKETPLLRANYIMRGVQVPAGSHTVQFKYRPPVDSLWVTLSAMVVAIGLCGFLAVAGRRKENA
jgi:hypothetical protein